MEKAWARKNLHTRTTLNIYFTKHYGSCFDEALRELSPKELRLKPTPGSLKTVWPNQIDERSYTTY